MQKYTSPEAEAAILGSMLLDPECCPEVIEAVKEEYFSLLEHKWLYRAISTIAKSDTALDAVVLRNELKRHNRLDSVGGVDYICKLLESVPSSASVMYYCDIVFDKWRERELLSYADKVKAIVAKPEPVEEKILQTETELHCITQKCVKQDIICVADYIDQVRFDCQTYTSTGYNTVDNFIYGLSAGDMITIAGRPGSGKSCLLVNIATNLASRGMPVAMFSLEMPKEQLQQRMLCSLARVDLKSALQGTLTKKQEQAIDLARQWMRRHLIYIDDTPRLTPSRLRFKVMQLVARHNVKAIFVDYLQLMTAEAGKSLNEKATEISQALKQIALEFRVPVITAAQLNRSPEARDAGEPRVSDLRDSGSIEQDSDVVILIHRKDLYGSGKDGHTNIIVGKNRRGSTGTAPMIFLGQYTLFTEPIYEKEDNGNTRAKFQIPSLLDKSS